MWQSYNTPLQKKKKKNVAHPTRATSVAAFVALVSVLFHYGYIYLYYISIYACIVSIHNVERTHTHTESETCLLYYLSQRTGSLRCVYVIFYHVFPSLSLSLSFMFLLWF